jgi:exodeoxyribonuclease X
MEIIEAAWIRIDPDGASEDNIPHPWDVKSWSQRFHPDKPSTFGAMGVHHILPEELVNCPPSSSFTLPEDCTYLIGHSIDFDWQAIGSPPNVKRICTDAMSRWVWPNATGYSQVALMYMLMGPTPATRNQVKMAHGALADVCMNMALLSYILQAKPEIKTWSALWEFSEECRIPRTCPLKRWEGILLEDMEYGAVQWCLNQDWLDPYFRKGLERMMVKRYGRQQEDFL